MHTKTVMFALGYSGLLPFYATALWICWPDAPAKALAADAFVVYGTVILAFLGGTLWGYAITVAAPAKYSRLIVSNVVALFAAAAGLLDSPLVACLLLALGHVLVLTYERRTADPNGWYLTFRTRLVMGLLPAHALLATGLGR